MTGNQTFDKRITFYLNILDLLPPKPKFIFRHMKQGIQQFHRKYVLVPADKAANNVVVVWRFHYINTLIQKLGSTKTYERTSTDETSIVDNHCCHITTKFAVGISENQEKLPTLYWLPKLHKRPYKSRFIANSSSCTTTEWLLALLLTKSFDYILWHLLRKGWYRPLLVNKEF